MELPIILDDSFVNILDQLEYTTDHYFITGKAGTGKSTLLQVFRSTSKKRLVVLAPTGIAALNVKGQTIHSFFGFPPRLLNPDEITVRRNRSLYKNLDLIIIDEISMVRADLLDNIDLVLRINRDSTKPFGGVQMVLFGDLFQLPPVVSTQFEKQYFSSVYASPYFFSAKVMQHFKYHQIELYKVYRQHERQFISLLDAIRQNTLEFEDFELLNQRLVEIPQDKEFYITLCSRNDIANKINTEELSYLPTEKYTFLASITGEFNPQLFPTDWTLELKEGAQVMLLKNDPQRSYVNGTIGIIESCTNDSIRIKLEKSTIEIEKHTWEIIRYELNPENPSSISSKVIGTFTQYPIKLAWAITIHKSQGKTFDKIIIDLGRGAFEAGQTYVALSRCRTLEGIILKQPIRNKDIFIDERITEYYQTLRFLN